jgi:signal transduction histidine kinase
LTHQDAARCAATGLALNEDPLRRRHSLYAFATGHLLLGLFVWFQWTIYWGDRGVPLPVGLAPLAAGLLLLTAAIVDSRPWAEPGTDQPGARPLRSTYDEQVRQLARREERARLARDLHDAVKQQLFVIQTAAATAQTRFDTDAAGARAALAQVRTAAREATTEMEALLEDAPPLTTGTASVRTVVAVCPGSSFPERQRRRIPACRLSSAHAAVPRHTGSVTV